MGQVVRAVLDGRTWTYDATDADGAWLFAVQRCGDFPGTALLEVEEVNQDGTSSPACRSATRRTCPALPAAHVERRRPLPSHNPDRGNRQPTRHYVL